MTVIKVEELSVFAGSARLIGPVSFEVAAGGTLVIMGETGAGKSLVAQAILGNLPGGLRAEGVIHINGRRVDTLNSGARAALWGHEIATLPQEPWRALDPLMAAWRQVSEAHVHVAGLAKPEARQATQDDFMQLGLAGAEARLPGQLSGGMAQRVAFAAATAGKAPILLADEPTKGLDAARQAKVVELLAEVPNGGGTLLAITHEAPVAQALGGNLIVLRGGDIVETGRTAEVLAAPKAPYTRRLIEAAPGAWSKTPAAPHGGSILRAKGVEISRGGKTLLTGFDLDLRASERVALVGPSGVGKTSLLDALAGLITPSAGSVTRAPEVGRHGIQKLYQDPPAAFPPHVSLGQTLRDVARLHRTKWDKVEDNIKALGLHAGLLNRRPDSVSGGELQRISIVRALIARPRILLADEPTSRLDPITQQSTMALLAEIARDQQIAVFLVTHHPDIAANWADRFLELRRESVQQVTG